LKNSFTKISSIHHDFYNESSGNLVEGEVVVGDVVDFEVEAVAAGVEAFAECGGGEAFVGESDVELCEEDFLGVEEVEEFVEPIEEEVVEFFGGACDVEGNFALGEDVGGRIDEDRGEASGGFGEELGEVGGGDAEKEVGRAVDDFVHGLPRGCRVVDGCDFDIVNEVGRGCTRAGVLRREAGIVGGGI